MAEQSRVSADTISHLEKEVLCYFVFLMCIADGE